MQPSVKEKEARKNLLIIAPEVPRYDCNSGDLRLFSLLKLLAGDYRISYLPMKLRPGAEKYHKDLEALGVEVVPVGTPISLLLRRQRFSAALLEFYHYADYFMPRIRLMQPDCRIVVDTVDVHFLREEMAGRVTGDGALLERAAETKRQELSAYSRADVVVTVTEDDGRALTDACAKIKVRVVPNIHEMAPDEAAVKDTDLIFVGGFQHPPNVDAVLYFCREILPLVRRQVPGVRVKIVGSNPTAEVLALGCEQVVVTGFVPSTAPYLHASRVSIAPLRIGAGMKGKIGEAMAHGVPVVTTSVGAQGMGLEDGVNVLIADQPAKFAQAVLRLLTCPELSETISANALEHLSRNFTTVQAARRMSEILAELERTPVRKMPLADKARFYRGWLTSRVRGFRSTDRHMAAVPVTERTSAGG